MMENFKATHQTMKKKTPMQFLLEKIENGDFLNHRVIGEFIKYNLLEKEKEELIQAVYRGDEGESFYGSAGDLEGFINARQDAEEWFERTYESND